MLKHRLKRIGIDVELACNYPWIYLVSVNGKKVTEKYMSEYGYTIAFLTNSGKIKITSLGIIRKYLKNK